MTSLGALEKSLKGLCFDGVKMGMNISGMILVIMGLLTWNHNIDVAGSSDMLIYGSIALSVAGWGLVTFANSSHRATPTADLKFDMSKFKTKGLAAIMVAVVNAAVMFMFINHKSVEAWQLYAGFASIALSWAFYVVSISRANGPLDGAWDFQKLLFGTVGGSLAVIGRVLTMETRKRDLYNKRSRRSAYAYAPGIPLYCFGWMFMTMTNSLESPQDAVAQTS